MKGDESIMVYTQAEVFFRPYQEGNDSTEIKAILRCSPSYGASKSPWRDFIVVSENGESVLCQLWAIFRMENEEIKICGFTYSRVGLGSKRLTAALPWNLCIKDRGVPKIFDIDAVIDTAFVLPYQDCDRLAYDRVFYVRKEAYFD